MTNNELNEILLASDEAITKDNATILAYNRAEHVRRLVAEILEDRKARSIFDQFEDLSAGERFMQRNSE